MYVIHHASLREKSETLRAYGYDCKFTKNPQSYNIRNGISENYLRSLTMELKYGIAD